MLCLGLEPRATHIDSLIYVGKKAEKLDCGPFILMTFGLFLFFSLLILDNAYLYFASSFLIRFS